MNTADEIARLRKPADQPVSGPQLLAYNRELLAILAALDQQLSKLESAESAKE